MLLVFPFLIWSSARVNHYHDFKNFSFTHIFFIYISLKKLSIGDLLKMQAEIVDETDVYIDVHKRYCSGIYYFWVISLMLTIRSTTIVKLHHTLPLFQGTCGGSCSSSCIIHNTCFTSGKQATLADQIFGIFYWIKVENLWVINDSLVWYRRFKAR